MRHLLGIDEAGRGPLIGPMIMAGFVCPDIDVERLRQEGVKDSKLLSDTKRESLFEYLSSRYRLKEDGFAVHSCAMYAPKDIDCGNLNDLTKKGTVGIIVHIIRTRHKFMMPNIDKIILDCPEQNTLAYASEIEFLIKRDYKDIKKIPPIIAEHKADVHYIPVSAASIIAKHGREDVMNKIRAEHGDCGSGYTSDPKTLAFLRFNLGDKERDHLFRHSWATYRRMKALLESGEIVRKKRI